MKRKTNSTEAFREKMLIERILPHLRWKGVQLVCAYTWNGEPRKAIIKLSDLIKIIKWDVKPMTEVKINKTNIACWCPRACPIHDI